MRFEDLQKHMIASYFTLRIGMGITAMLFPLVLVFGAMILGDDFERSMSAYYHTSMRDVFVGVLFSVGAFLYLYKGYSNEENIALNIAGLFVVGVALFPTDFSDPVSRFQVAALEGEGLGVYTSPVIHGVCAVIFFLAIAYVSIFRASDTLHLIEDEHWRVLYKRIYRMLGVGMVVLPLVAVALLFFYEKVEYSVFFVELAAIWCFGLYWLCKSKEFYETKYENRLLNLPV